MSRYKVYVCGPRACPNDPGFEHDGYYGCIPKDFNPVTGGSREFHQERVEGPDIRPPYGYKFFWDGGCDAVKLATLRPPAGQTA